MGVFTHMSRDEMDAFWRDRMKKIETARAAIIAKHTPLPEMGAAGHIDCPICTRGRLHYVISPYNKHVAAVCTTEDCVSWRE